MFRLDEVLDHCHDHSVNSRLRAKYWAIWGVIPKAAKEIQRNQWQVWDDIAGFNETLMPCRNHIWSFFNVFFDPYQDWFWQGRQSWRNSQAWNFDDGAYFNVVYYGKVDEMRRWQSAQAQTENLVVPCVTMVSESATLTIKALTDEGPVPMLDKGSLNYSSNAVVESILGMRFTPGINLKPVLPKAKLQTTTNPTS